MVKPVDMLEVFVRREEGESIGRLASSRHLACWRTGRSSRTSHPCRRLLWEPDICWD